MLAAFAFAFGTAMGIIAALLIGLVIFTMLAVWVRT
jgi:hypothetical protein